MPIRTILLAFTAFTATAQLIGVGNPFPAINDPAINPQDLPALESAHQASPDDLLLSARLLRYYETGTADPDWNKRFTLLTSNIQRHPSAAFLGNAHTWRGMPASFREQVKQSWIAQVLQHPDDPMILRNAAAAMDTAIPQSIRVGGNVQKENLLFQTPAVYPALAKQARIQGTVRFNATIGPEGRIQNLQLVSGHPLLAAAAIQAVQQNIYKPTLLNGNPVTVVTTVDVEFTLQP